MDLRYTRYIQGDAFFYETPERAGGGGRAGSYDWVLGALPRGWERRRNDDWTFLTPESAVLPQQGWKIHVAATRADTTRTLRDVARYCFAAGLPFKHLATEAVYFAANQKYANRSGSGKFITIYPFDDEAAAQVCEDLDGLVGGRPGPYILSDVRFRKGPVYVRWGGFHLRTTLDDAGQLVPAVVDPNGTLVPDERNPWFSPPPWVQLPPFVMRSVEALGDETRPEGFDYAIDEALHFSNGGGVYLARPDRSNKRVVLKEGRPEAGITADGRDAAARVRDEAEVLRLLSDVPYVPDLIETLTVEGHAFLVEQHVEGRTLNKASVERMPLIRADCSRLGLLAYRDWAVPILKSVRDAVEDLHARGIVFGDVHPENIIVTEDGKPVLVDFEMASSADEPPTPVMGAPGYVPPDGRTGVEADRYALGVLHLALFLPLGPLLPLDPSKARSLLASVVAQFELGAEFHSEVLSLLEPIPDTRTGGYEHRSARVLVESWNVGTASGIEGLLDGIRTGIADAAEFSRADRIFPGDIEQFHTNGWNLAWGAAGVLASGSIRDEPLRRRVERWIHRAVVESDGQRNVPLGLLDGLAGLLHTADEDVHDRFVKDIEGVDLERLDSSLVSGLSGIGLACLHSPRVQVDTVVRDISQILEHRMLASVPESTVATGRGGLMRGPAGLAGFWIELFEVSGDDRALELAEQAIRIDLAALVECPDGSLQMNEGWRAVPYLGSGSIGVGVVLSKFLRHRRAPDLQAALEQIARAANAPFVIQPGWWNGRAGLIEFQLAVAEPMDLPSTADQHVRELRQHALVHGCGVHFPGEQLLRCSTDLLTGSAGIHRVLERYGSSRGLLSVMSAASPLDLIMPTITERNENDALPVDLASAAR